ncbi:MAG: SUMF1/EgtB/PvdO family nonheme iron enzyme [Anaerolineae bacterium]|nr:SUMF1/EgtB/PvdO family nonheme iron enzyme [Anaerolineae bacterium]
MTALTRSADAETLIEQLHVVPVPAGTATLGLEAEIAAKFIKAYGDMWQNFFGRETPLHNVEIASFDLMRYPVTNGLYARFMVEGGYSDPQFWTPDGWAWKVSVNRTHPRMWNNPKFAGEDRPVVGVSWFEAMAVAQWASIRTGLNVRLPTEAEWEWAARATNVKSLYPWGGAWDPDKLNSGVAGVGSTNRGSTTPIGLFSPHGDGPFGHGDQLGQVWEWTSSAFLPYPYSSADGREDVYAPERRVLRGGNWSDGKYANRVTTRYYYTPFYADVSTGFRLAVGGERPALPARPKRDLVIYGRTTFCPDLSKARVWLHQLNVPYRQLNIDLDEAAAFRLDDWLGTRTIPTFVVADYASIDPVEVPTDANLSNLRDTDRGSMLHEPDESTLHAFLVRNGFLREKFVTDSGR